jgi:hypothetical protein
MRADNIIGCFLLIALFTACAAVERDSIRSEYLSMTLAERWSVGHSHFIPGGRIIEWIKPGDTIDDWKQLLYQTRIKKTHAPGTVEEWFEAKKAQTEEQCPGANRWSILERDENSILFEHETKGCKSRPDQIRLGRIVDGKWTRFEVEYNRRDKQMFPSERDSWIAILSRARAVEGR